VRRALTVAVTIAAAIGCNQILGNNNFKTAIDAATDGPDDQCAAMGLPPTSLVGKVYAPNGTLALYNAAVYVPSGPLAPIPDGVGPPTCVSGAPLALTHSDETGLFQLDHVRSGDVPLVVQIGKWRREHVTVHNVQACMVNNVQADDTRLPKLASEGSIPHIAITTGAADTIECIGRDLGLAATEIGTGSSATAHVRLYNQNGAASLGPDPLPPATDLDSAAELAKYDLVMRGCAGSAVAPGSGAPDLLQAWTNAGGWAFLEHYGATWLVAAPAPWPNLATFNVAGGGANGSGTVFVDTTPPIGQAMAQWLVAVGISTTPGSFIAQNYRSLCTGIDAQQATRRLYLDPALGSGSSDIQSFTWEAAMGGRVTFNDIHVSGNAIGSASYPTECLTPYPQESVIMFQMLETPTCAP
jgi:hypothetical protein